MFLNTEKHEGDERRMESPVVDKELLKWVRPIGVSILIGLFYMATSLTQLKEEVRGLRDFSLNSKNDMFTALEGKSLINSMDKQFGIHARDHQELEERFNEHLKEHGIR